MRKVSIVSDHVVVMETETVGLAKGVHPTDATTLIL